MLYKTENELIKILQREHRTHVGIFFPSYLLWLLLTLPLFYSKHIVVTLVYLSLPRVVVVAAFLCLILCAHDHLNVVYFFYCILNKHKINK